MYARTDLVHALNRRTQRQLGAIVFTTACRYSIFGSEKMADLGLNYRPIFSKD